MKNTLKDIKTLFLASCVTVVLCVILLKILPKDILEVFSSLKVQISIHVVVIVLILFAIERSLTRGFQKIADQMEKS